MGSVKEEGEGHLDPVKVLEVTGFGGTLAAIDEREIYESDKTDNLPPTITELEDVQAEGHIKDSEGRTVDFKNTIIIMTSNAADQAICDVCAQTTDRIDNDKLLESIRPDLQQYFKPAFLGRTTIVPYYPLNDEELAKITEISLNRIKKKLAEQYKASFTWDTNFIQFVVDRNTDPTTGGRAVEQIINRSLMPRLAEECIGRLSRSEPITQVTVSATNNSADFDLSIK